MSQFNLPNALSVSRAVLAPVAFILIVDSNWILVAGILLIALVTDLADGEIARRRQQTSALGGFLDHGSDALLVASMLAAEAVLGLVTPILPVLVIVAFTQYTLDSKALQGQPLRASRLGKYNGILYFIVAGFPVLQPVVNIELLSREQVYGFSFLMVVLTLVSIFNRAWAYFRTKSR